MATVSKRARREIVAALRSRYAEASKTEKGKILAEFCAVSGSHRKHAVRLLRAGQTAGADYPAAGRRVYDEAVRETLLILWEASDRICGKRLKALLPSLIDAMERHGHIHLVPDVRTKVLSASAATIDRMLRPMRREAGARRRRCSAKKVSKQIPLKVFSDWANPVPGFMEIDFVVHGGGSMSGEYLHSLVATDVCSGWVEAVSLLAREQNLVAEGLERIRMQMPVPVLGIDSDNDGAFINETVLEYCERERIVFTRSRPYHKNDQAWIEQKNGAVVRKMVGHERLSGIVAGQALAQLLQVATLYVNFFQPSFKLRERIREGSKIRRFYDLPAAACDRLLARPDISADVKESLRRQRERLDPVELLHRIRQGQAALAALSNGVPASGPDRRSLDEFLASLPSLWRQGEVRPTHRQQRSVVRTWRMREDPFADAWADILLWLQDDPDSTAKSLLERLQEKSPSRYPDKLLRTLQRRVLEWRQAMARKLVFSGSEQVSEVKVIAP